MAEEEIDEEAEDGEGPQEDAGGSRLKQFMVLAVLVLMGQIAVTYVLVTRLVLPKQAMEAAEEGTGQEGVLSEPEEIQIETPLLYEFDDMIMNSMDDQVIRYLNTKIAVELDNQSVLDELKNNKVVAAQTADLIRRTLNTTYYHQMDEPGERLALREVIKKRLNESLILQTGQVSAVYFERFIVQ